MRIGIIGAGRIGGTLTRRFRALGHEVFVANSRGPQSLADLAAETGATPATVEEAAHAGEIVVVTIPEGQIRNLPPNLFLSVPPSVIVIDTGNYYPRQRDGRIDDIENGMPESLWVQKQLGHAVVKAFNNMYWRHLLERGLPPGTAGRLAIPVAGDDEAAKAFVMRLVDELGFDPIDAGSLADSWRQQPGTPAYAKDLDAPAMRKALSEARRERTAEWSAA